MLLVFGICSVSSFNASIDFGGLIVLAFLAFGVLAVGLLAFLAVVGLLCAEPRELSFKCCNLHVALVLGENPHSHRDVGVKGVNLGPNLAVGRALYPCAGGMRATRVHQALLA